MTVGTWRLTVQPEKIAAVRRALSRLPLDDCHDDGDSGIAVQTKSDCWDLLFLHHRLRSVPGVSGVALVSAIDEGASA